MKIKIVIHTIISWFLLSIISVVYAIPVFVFLCIPKRWRYASTFIFRVTDWFYWAILKCSLISIKFKGRGNIPNKPVIFAANHQSSLDIPLLGVLANSSPHIWLAKKELMDSVVLRFIVPLFAVLVDMSTPKAGIRSLRRILSLMEQGDQHVMIFPEGGRYTDDKVHDFFGGFVILAKKTGRPVVPVCIIGVNKVYPPDTFLVHRHPVTVVVGKPFTYTQQDTDESFKQRVHQWFVEKMGSE